MGLEQQIASYICSLAGTSNWNAQPWGNGKGMKGGWEQPKGKGKGKGEKGDKGKGKAKGETGKAGKGGKGEDGIQCGCCGKPHHSKPECYHKYKACSHCGMVGHLKHMCKKLKAEQAKEAQADTPGAQTQPPKQNAAPLEPWMCLDCNQSNPSTKKRICSTRYCTGVCPVTYKEAAAKAEAAPTAVSPKTQGHIVDAAPERVQLTADELKASIAADKELIVRFKQPLLPGTKPMDVTQLETAVADKEKQLRQVLDAAAPVLKGMAGDHNREKHNHEQKMEKMKADLSELEQKKTKGQQEKEKQLKEEQERHIEKMASLEKQYETAIDAAMEKIKVLKEKLEAEEEAHKEKMAAWATTFASTAPEELSEAFAKSVKTAVTTEIKEEEIKIHMLKDPTLVQAQLSTEQANVVAASFKDYALAMRAEMMASVRKEMGLGTEAETKPKKVEQAEQRAKSSREPMDTSEKNGTNKRPGGEVSKDDEEAKKKQDVSRIEGEDQHSAAQGAVSAATAQQQQQQQLQQHGVVPLVQAPPASLLEDDL